MARIPYLDEEEASSEAAAALRDVRERRGLISPVQRALAHSPAALRAYEECALAMSDVSGLDPRTRELVILRSAQWLRNPYAWRRHLAPAVDAGLTEDELRSLASWAERSEFSEAERAVLRLVDEQLGRRAATDATIEAVRRHYGDGLLIELLATLGWYAFAAVIMVSLDLAADDPVDDVVVAFEPAETT